MRNKNSSKRTLSNKNTSYLQFPNKLQKYSRFLNKRGFDNSPQKKPKLKNELSNLPSSADDHKENLTRQEENVNNAIPKLNKCTQELSEDDMKHGRKQSLTRANLKKLQGEIFDKELNNIACHHCLCSAKNRKDIKYSRLWFLFELEMSENWKENLRLSCYNKYVYSAIDKSWIMENILLKEQEKNYKYFPIQQLLIPNIDECSNKQKRPEDIEDITVDIDSIIEISHRKERFLPESFLVRRENEIAFNDCQLDAKKILGDLSTTSENPFNSSPYSRKVKPEREKLDTIPTKKKEKKILGALEKKLHIGDNY